MLAFDYTPRGQISTATAYSASTPAEALSEITYGYDGFGNLTSEQLSPEPGTSSLAKTVTYGWEWVNQQNRLTGITYPSGREFTFDYTRDGQTWTNAIGRMTGMSEVGGTNNPLIAYTTTGGGRNVKKIWGGSDVTLDYTPSTDPVGPAGFDRFGRVTTMDFQKSDGSTIHKYAYGYDANGNRTYARITQAGHPNDRSFLYGYDNLNRLVHAERGILNSLNNAILPNGKGQAWNLDVLGNWSGGSSDDSLISYTVGPLAGNNPGYDSAKDAWTEKRHDTTDEANRINTLRTEANGEPVENDDFYYDAAGNLVLDDEKFYKYDAWNRVVEVHEKGDYHVDAAGDLAGTDLGDLIATYEYDVLGRMIHKTVSASGDLNTTGDGDYFYYDGHRLLEHHKHDGTSLALYRQYVYGLDYIDEVVAYYDSDETPTDPHFILQDVNYNVVATTSSNGALEQQFTFKPYGERATAQRIESDGTITDILATPSLIATTKAHQGLDHMPEIDGVNNRVRILRPDLGRFMQHDPNETSLVVVDAMLTNAQNAVASASLSAGAQYSDGLSLYGYLGSNPFNGRDPSGLINASPRRMLTEMIGAAVTAYAFGLDAGVYSLLEGGPTAKGLDEALAAFPHLIPGALLGGLVSGATWFSSTGNILGGGIAGGYVTDMMGQGFKQGFVTGAATTAVFEALFAGVGFFAKKIGGWFDSMVVGSGPVGASAGRGGLFWRVARRRGFLGVCFAAGTSVAMHDGTLVPIEELRAGNTVLCRPDADKPQNEGCVVLRTLRRSTDRLMRIVLDDSETLHVTPEHPVWVSGKGWTPAGELKSNDVLETSYGVNTVVRSIDDMPMRKGETIAVYNLEIERHNNYFVGNAGVLVHNANYGCDQLGVILSNRKSFRRWLGSVENTQRPLSQVELDRVLDAAQEYGLSIRQSATDAVGHPGTQWPDPHIHIDDKHINLGPGVTR